MPFCGLFREWSTLLALQRPTDFVEEAEKRVAPWIRSRGDGFRAIASGVDFFRWGRGRRRRDRVLQEKHEEVNFSCHGPLVPFRREDRFSGHPTPAGKSRNRENRRPGRLSPSLEVPPFGWTGGPKEGNKGGISQGAAMFKRVWTPTLFSLCFLLPLHVPWVGQRGTPGRRRTGR